MERRDLYQDDLTEERYPSPARRNDEAATQVLDPDASAADGNAGPTPKGPGSVHGEQTAPDDDEDEDDEDDEELDDELND